MSGSSIPPHVIVICTSPSCAMRFPMPVGDLRHGTCPACEAPTVDIEPGHESVPATGSVIHPGATVGVLDNLRSAMNVGTIFRAADGARLSQLSLCGLTPAGDHPKVAKTALGAEISVPWTHEPDAVVAVEALRDQGWHVWACEATERSEPLESVAEVPDRVAVVVGNERAGVDPGVLRRAERHVHLPMAGAKSTLNVGVAFGIMVYAIRDRRARAGS